MAKEWCDKTSAEVRAEIRELFRLCSHTNGMHYRILRTELAEALEKDSGLKPVDWPEWPQQGGGS